MDTVIFNQDVAVLSAYLSHVGLENELIFEELEKENLENTIKELAPDYILLMTELRAHLGIGDLVDKMREVESISKNLNVPVVLFGRRATIASRELLKTFPFIHAIAVGDPEHPIEQLIKNGSRENIPGISFLEKSGNIVTPGVGQQTDLTSLPRPNFDSFYSRVGADKMGYFLQISRGCVYNCTFCQSAEVQSLTTDTKKMPRYYPVDWIIDNLCYLNEAYGPITNFYVTDTNFTMSKPYLREFTKKYSDKLNIPYVCATRANLVDDEVATLLKNSNCSRVNFGIEAGDEETRNVLLNKNLMDSHIDGCLKSLKAKKIRSAAGIIIGLPGDTFNSALDSVYKAIKFGPDILMVNLFQPDIGTPLSKTAIIRGDLKADFTQWRQTKSKNQGISALNLKDRELIENLALLSPIFQKIPNKRLMSALCRIPRNRLFLAIYHFPRMLRSLKYELYDETVLHRVEFFFKNLARIVLKGERAYNR